MIEIVLIGTAAFFAGLGLRSVLKPGPKKPKFPCPWDPCGYPLPKTPLFSKPETDSHYAEYASEECQGCGNTVLWSEYDGDYLRVPKKT